jgi:hypothetical protein
MQSQLNKKSTSAFIGKTVVTGTAIGLVALVMCATPTNANQSERIFEQLAAHFLAFAEESERAALDAPNSATRMAHAVDRSGQVTSPRIGEGLSAFVVLVAAAHPEYRAGVEAKAHELGREQLMASIKADPSSVRQLTGYSSAVDLASASKNSAITRIKLAANSLGEAAYSLQRHPWAKQRVDMQGRLEAYTAASQAPYAPPVYDFVKVTSQPRASGGETPGGVSDRLLAAAALTVLDDTYGAMHLTQKPATHFCLRRARLNVRQCLAVSAFPYEQSFCLAKHGYEEPTGCLEAATQ